MKVMYVLRILACLAVAFLFESPRAYAQSEIDPDHFEAQPLQQAKPATSQVVHYDGKFKLPYEVRCNGKSLRPGSYSLSFNSSGSIGRVTLRQKGEPIEITGVLYLQAHREGRNVLFVESDGITRRLSAIHVAALDLVFDKKQQADQTSRPKIRIERLPLT